MHAPQILKDFRWGNIHLWHGWQKVFCLFTPQARQMWTHGFVAAGCLAAVSPASSATPKFRGPQLRENGSIGPDRLGFCGRAEVPSVLDYNCWKTGSDSSGRGHGNKTLSQLMLSLSYLHCISAGLSKHHCGTLARHMLLRLLMLLHLQEKGRCCSLLSAQMIYLFFKWMIWF